MTTLTPTALAMLYPKALQVIAEGKAKQDIFYDLPPQILQLPIDTYTKPHFQQYLPTKQPCYRLSNSSHLCFGADNFQDQPVAIIATWSATNSFAPYLKYYARCLRTQGYKLIISCGFTPDSPSSLSTICDALIYRTCPGYDFTSFKIAFELFPSLYQAQELLLTNDSIYAPLTPLAKIHTQMSKLSCDFWGLLSSKDTLTHLQSYYLLFTPKVLQHPAWQQFWATVDTNSQKFDTVARYEVMLTAWLTFHNFTPGVYIPPQALPDTNLNPTHYFWRELITRFNFPILKRDLWRECKAHPHLWGLEDLLDSLGYNRKLLTT